MKLFKSIMAASFLLVVFSQLTTAQTFTVEHYGELRQTIRQGDVSASVDLNNMQSIENLYALGAFEGLKGEILIVNGRSLSTRALNDDVQFVNTSDKKATLLVTASVDAWKSFKLGEDVPNEEGLEKRILSFANLQGIGTDQPIPFLIEAEADALDWHVIDWPEGDNEHTHEKHKTSGPHGTLENQKVVILGFWSDSHHGIFTHHATNMHMHFVTGDETLAGHIDGFSGLRNVTLKLPAASGK